jgi:SAM-dependent methyltransferase
MSTMTTLEEAIYNEGERLIPGVSHGLDEQIRHVSSYEFMLRVIRHDMATRPDRPHPVRIVDLGCGVGHGCYTLSAVPDSQVTGIDCSIEPLIYARQHYHRRNIVYQQHDLRTYAAEMPEFDYVVSRGVLEHIVGGLQLAVMSRWRARMLIDVPYDENVGNPHHVLHHVLEKDFAEFPDAELFYEDLAGVIYDRATKPPRPNMIMCVCSRPDLDKATGLFAYPLPAWAPAPAAPPATTAAVWRRAWRWLRSGLPVSRDSLKGTNGR